MDKKNILVTGSEGQLGTELRDLAGSTYNSKFYFASRVDLPIEDSLSLEKYFSENLPGYCINCAAYTAVDKAESEATLAFKINATAVGNLAAICKKYGTCLIHISTDYVFNGNAYLPYKESDATDPVNLYGATKLQGEELALKNNDQTIVIRTSWLYSSHGNNFVKTMLRLMKERTSIGVVNDQFGNPTYAADLAAAILQIIQNNDPKPGIYHYCNKGTITWYELACAIKEYSGSNCTVKPVDTSGYPTPAKRPAYSALDTTKIEEQFDLNISVWKESLERCIKRLGLEHS